MVLFRTKHLEVLKHIRALSKQASYKTNVALLLSVWYRIYSNDTFRKQEGLCHCKLKRNVISALKIVLMRLLRQAHHFYSMLVTDGSLVLYTFNDDEGKKAFWHSSAHVLAECILEFYPKAKGYHWTKKTI